MGSTRRLQRALFAAAKRTPSGVFRAVGIRSRGSRPCAKNGAGAITAEGSSSRPADPSPAARGREPVRGASRRSATSHHPPGGVDRRSSLDRGIRPFRDRVDAWCEQGSASWEAAAHDEEPGERPRAGAMIASPAASRFARSVRGQKTEAPASRGNGRRSCRGNSGSSGNRLQHCSLAARDRHAPDG